MLAVDRDAKIRDGGRDVVQLRLQAADPRRRVAERRADLAAARAAAGPLSAARRRSRRRQRRDRLGPLRPRGSGLRQGAAVDERAAADVRLREPDADGNPDPDFKDGAADAALGDARVPAQRHARALRRGLRQPDEGRAPRRDQDDRSSPTTARSCTRRRTSARARSCRAPRGGYGYTTTIDTEDSRARPLRPACRGDDAPDRRRQGDARARVPASGERRHPDHRPRRRQPRSCRRGGGRADDEEWRAMWRAHAGPDTDAPPVDFAARMVAAVFQGQRPSAGFDTSIVGAAVEGGVLTVQVDEHLPATGARGAPGRSSRPSTSSRCRGSTGRCGSSTRSPHATEVTQAAAPRAALRSLPQAPASTPAAVRGRGRVRPPA